jgi:succinyl-diaminopimelate desuccinylase
MPVDLLRQLIACASITPDDAGCQRIVAQRLLGAGFTVEHLKFGETDNLWATHGSGAPLFCFAGHTDVVPPGPLEDWMSEPFVPTERNGNLYGRGAADMKGSDAAMVVALERLAQQGHEGTIALLLTSDEEGLGLDGTKRVLETLTDRGVKIDAAVVGEPTSEQTFGDVVKIGRRGSLSGHLKVNGVQGHTAYPHLARNAAHRLAPALNALIQLDWGTGTEHFQPTTLQVSNLKAGNGAGNVIPGSAEVWFNVRYGVDWTAEAIQEKIEAVLRDQGLEEVPDWNASALPFLTEAGALVSAMVEAIEKHTGQTPKLTTGGGTSDARFFPLHGIPVAEFGPLNASIHAANENVSIADLERLVAIYVDVAGKVSRTCP